MIDRPARDAAAALVRGFRDGSLSNDALVDSWPRSVGDRALRAVATRLWGFYDDNHTHSLTAEFGPTAEIHAELTRFALFLDGDLPYEWPQDDFIRIGNLRPLAIATLGVLWPVHRWNERRNAQLEAAHEAVGDAEAWPFIRRSDIEHANGQPRPVGDLPNPHLPGPHAEATPARRDRARRALRNYAGLAVIALAAVLAAGATLTAIVRALAN